jgi:biotin operon repressor
LSWFEEAKRKKEELSKQGINYSYNDIAKEFDVNYDTVRKKFKKDIGACGVIIKEMNISNPTSNSTSFIKVIEPPPKSLEEQVLEALKQEVCIPILADNLEVSENVLKAVIKDISAQGYNIFESGDYAKLSKVAVPTEEVFNWNWDGSQVIKMGIVSDTHLCSKYQQLTHLNTIYDIFARENIRRVLNIGDITEGINMRKGHEYELFIHGLDEQADYVIDKYPVRDGIITDFITGNHDHTGIKSAGADIGKRIARERKDMKYLGLANARINITPKCIVELNHGLDGSCFDDQTEILTKRGWIKFAELTKEDFVATMTKEEHTFEWQQPSEITKQKYEGNLYHFKARCLDMLVTPNHGMWTRENPIKANRKEDLIMPQKSLYTSNFDWRRETAKEIYNSYYRQKWQFTNVCNDWKGTLDNEFIQIPHIESKNIGMKDRMQHLGKVHIKYLCELIAWYVTEGYADNKRVCISQSERVNSENHKKITDLIKRLNLRYGIQGIDNKDITISSKELSTYLISNCGDGSYNKYLPSFIKELPKEYLQSVIDIMIEGDGWVNGKALGYKSVSPQLRTDFMEIAIKCGYGVSENKDTVNLTKLQVHPTLNSKPELVPYRGEVYCCKVPNGLILVRRNGRATWSHNSYALSYTLQKFIDALDASDLPNIFLNGHHHKLMYTYYRSIHALECGTLQRQTPWMKGKRLSAHVGGIVLTVHVDGEGKVTRFIPEFIPFYKFIDNDY